MHLRLRLWNVSEGGKQLLFDNEYSFLATALISEFRSTLYYYAQYSGKAFINKPY